MGEKSLWADEGSSLYFSRLPVEFLWQQLCDPHPPGYYLLLRALIGPEASEAWIRLPSALAGAAAVPLTGALAFLSLRPHFSYSEHSRRQQAVLAAGLLAVAPLHLWYSQEARPYALVTTLSLAMVLAAVTWYRRPSAGRGALYLVTGWMALFADYGALLVWAGLQLFLVARILAAGDAEAGSPWRRFGRWSALQVLVLGPFAGWWLTSAQPSVLMQPSYQAVFLAVRAQDLGMTLSPAGARWLLAVAMAASAALALGIALLAARSRRLRTAVAVLALALLVALALAATLPRLYTVKRQVVVILPYLAVAAAWVTGRLREIAPRPWHGLGPLLLVMSLALSLVTVGTVPKAPWRTAVAALADQIQAGEPLWVDEMDAPVFAYYWRDRLPWQPLDSARLDSLEVGAGMRTWLLAGVSPYRGLHAILPASFAENHGIAWEQEWPGILLRAYGAAAPPDQPPPPPATLLWGLSLPSPLDQDCVAAPEAAGKLGGGLEVGGSDDSETKLVF